MPRHFRARVPSPRARPARVDLPLLGTYEAGAPMARASQPPAPHGSPPAPHSKGPGPSAYEIRPPHRPHTASSCAWGVSLGPRRGGAPGQDSVWSAGYITSALALLWARLTSSVLDLQSLVLCLPWTGPKPCFPVLSWALLGSPPVSVLSVTLLLVAAEGSLPSLSFLDANSSPHRGTFLNSPRPPRLSFLAFPAPSSLGRAAWPGPRLRFLYLTGLFLALAQLTRPLTPALPDVGICSVPGALWPPWLPHGTL